MSPKRTANSLEFNIPEQAALPSLVSQLGPAAVSGIHFPGDEGLKPGTVLDGKYRIVKTIGEGGMGRVYLADHMILHALCAVKVLSGRGLTKVAWKRFMQEATALSQMEHPNLVKVHDTGVYQNSMAYFVMDYVDGVSLETYLDEHGRMEEKTVLDVMHQICRGLEFAQSQGVVHRDIKPANIMLMPDWQNAGALRVKILDFGLAKLTDRSGNSVRLTGTGEFFGSPLYMSPEQCLGEKVDTRSDIYSLGCTMYECLTGDAPFSEGSVFAVMSNKLRKSVPSLTADSRGLEFSPQVAAIVDQMLQRYPDNRYETFGALKNALHHARMQRPQVIKRLSVEEAVEHYRTYSDGLAALEPHHSTESKADFEIEFKAVVSKTLLYKGLACLILMALLTFLCVHFFIPFGN